MGYYSGTIQHGSQGEDTKKWQQFLKSQGYDLDVDGIFGDITKKYTIDYQSKNGLDADGIVGKLTWGKAGFSDINTPVSAPTIDPMPTNPTYEAVSWDDTEKGQAALGAYNDAKDAVNNYGDFTFDEFSYGKQDQLDAILNKILNREEFSYDLNGDALYQQYKDKYIKQGKMAMGDAIGQASAMTGGYGNSYAQSVGQQAYQAQLDNLNDIVPELYQMALDKYNQEGQDMLNQYGMLSDDYNRAYGRYTDDYNRAYQNHTDGYNRLMDALGIAQGDYYDGATLHNTEQTNRNDVAGRTFDDAMSIWDANTTNAWRNAEWEESGRRWEIEDNRAEEAHNATYGNSSSGGTTSGTDLSGIKSRASGYTNNDDLANYLDGLASSGVISESQAYALYAEYKQADKVGLSKRSWTLVDDGGVNWLWGVDNNAKVKDQYGNTYRLDKLIDALVAEGMSKSDAKTYVKNLQKSLGA